MHEFTSFMLAVQRELLAMWCAIYSHHIDCRIDCRRTGNCGIQVLRHEPPVLRADQVIQILKQACSHSILLASLQEFKSNGDQDVSRSHVCQGLDELRFPERGTGERDTILVRGMRQGGTDDVAAGRRLADRGDVLLQQLHQLALLLLGAMLRQALHHEVPEGMAGEGERISQQHRREVPKLLVRAGADQLLHDAAAVAVPHRLGDEAGAVEELVDDELRVLWLHHRDALL